MAKKRVKKKDSNKKIPFKKIESSFLSNIEHHHYLLFFVLFLSVIALIYMSGSGIFGNEPWYSASSDLNEIAASCELAANNNLKSSYCNTFHEVKIEERKQYANCHYLKQRNYAEFENYGLTCNNAGVLIQQSAIAFCINNNLDKEDAINGIRCDSIAKCEVPEEKLTNPSEPYLNGIRRLEIEGCQTGEIDLTEYSKDSAEGVICCVNKVKAGITGKMIFNFF